MKKAKCSSRRAAGDAATARITRYRHAGQNGLPFGRHRRMLLLSSLARSIESRVGNNCFSFLIFNFSFAVLSFVSCLKEGRYDTTYILRPQVQTQSVDTAEPLTGVVAYAYDVDTLDWGIASYADAAAGIITRKNDPTQQLIEPVVRAVPYDGTLGTPETPDADGADNGNGTPTVDVSTWLQMPFGRSARMVVAVDPTNRLYGYTMQQPQTNLPRLYVSAVFQTWKEGNAYKNGAWSFYNEFYTPPVVLKAYYRPAVQTEEGGEEAAFASSSQIKAYAYVADTTD